MTFSHLQVQLVKKLSTWLREQDRHRKHAHREHRHGQSHGLPQRRHDNTTLTEDSHSKKSKEPGPLLLLGCQRLKVNNAAHWGHSSASRAHMHVSRSVKKQHGPSVCPAPLPFFQPPLTAPWVPSLPPGPT